jgi:hypothetical protein
MNVCPFSKYKNFLGIPLQGIHKYRFLDVAIVDYILTIVLSGITANFTNIPLVLTTIMWLIISIILHTLFGVETNTLKYLGIICKS